MAGGKNLKFMGFFAFSSSIVVIKGESGGVVLKHRDF
jgi:hypothetical protein